MKHAVEPKNQHIYVDFFVQQYTSFLLVFLQSENEWFEWK